MIGDTADLDNLDRDQAAALWRAAADRIADDPALAPLADRLHAWLDSGASRRGLQDLIPPAPRGGDHGRSEALAEAVTILRIIRRTHFSGCSNRQAAELIRAKIIEYRENHFPKARSLGKYPSPDSADYWYHYLTVSRALDRAGKMIEAKTIARHLGEGEADQMNFNSQLKFE